APMSFATGAEVADDEPGMHFRFSAEAFGETADIPAADIKANGDAAAPAFASANTDPWYIDGLQNINAYRLTSGTPDETYPNAKPNALYWNVKGTYFTPLGTGTAQAALALRVKIDETGVFTPSVTYEAGPTSNKYAFFLAPVSEYETGYTFSGTNVAYRPPLQKCFNAKERNAKLIELGEQNLYAPEESTKTVNFLPVKIEAGDYYLYIASGGRVGQNPAYNADALYDVNLYSLDLHPYGTVEGAPEISRAELSLADTSLAEGRTTSTSVKLYTGDGTAVSKAYKYLLESLNTSVATVDNATGVVTAVSAGKATIKATLAIDPDISSSAELTVTETPYLKKLVPALNQITLYMKGGESSATLTAQAKMSDDLVQSTENYNLTFESSDNRVATVVSDNGVATVTAVAPGSADITISTTNEKGDPVSVTVSVNVQETFGGIHFNFSAAGYGEEEDISAEEVKANGDSASPAFASIDTDLWYIDGQRLINDYRLTSEAPDTGAYPNAKPNALYWRVKNYGYLNPVTSGGVPTGNANASLALRVKISGKGTFTPSITYEAGPTSTNYAFFLAPASAYTASGDGYRFDFRTATTEASKLNGDQYITNQKPLSLCFKDGSQDPKLIELGEQNLYAPQESRKTVNFLPVQIEEPGDY
ncbi:MAG: Ig-like domain-containing protein, partial [Clostridia bacterium]|nr:Ig-like domain-containing protein [Clostridia bacterium]